MLGASYRSLLYFSYGAKRIRTADPLNAIEVLYQLSYNPVQRILHHALITTFRQASRKQLKLIQ